MKPASSHSAIREPHSNLRICCEWVDEVPKDGFLQGFDKVKCTKLATNYWREAFDMPAYKRDFYFALCSEHFFELCKEDTHRRCKEITQEEYLVGEVMTP